MRRVLVLRPQPGASETAARARDAGLDPVTVPLFKVEPIAWKAPEAGSFDAVLLTSANAVRCAGDAIRELRGLKAYAVGESTAEAAREAGFDIAAVGEAGVDRLLGSIESDLRLLHLCGEDRRAPDGARQRITAVPIYRSVAIDKPELSFGERAVAMIHSPRAARRFAELVEKRGSIAIAAISAAAAEAVGNGWARVEAAANPTDDALLALAARLCNNPDPE
jgi:uroporphyrinogen-III synthase